ncbi:MAG: hypothetical protein QOJ89_866 [bacterium]|jgi:hypothetical protein
MTTEIAGTTANVVGRPQTLHQKTFLRVPLAACHATSDTIGTMPPLLSVVMAVHNGERFLIEAVDSVLRQSVTELELVVVDDGSTDATPDLLRDVAARDRRVVVARHDNRGRTASLNRGVGLSRAPLVARLDADDVCLAERFARQVAFLERHPSVALVGGAVRLIDAGGREFEQSRYPQSDADIRRAFAYTTPFVHSAVMFRRSAFDGAGGYRLCFAETEDLDLWMRLAERHELSNLAEPVVAYRLHADQATVRRLETQALCLVAAHMSARARAAGDPDPLDGVAAIDERWLLEHGVTPREIATAIVASATWLAKLMGRAGYADQAEALLSDVEARVRSEPRPGALLAAVHRARAARRAAQARPLLARLERGRAFLAERRR